MLFATADGFAVQCCVCGIFLTLPTRSFDDARAEVLAGGWQERQRKGGKKKSAWACPTCSKPKASASMGATAWTVGEKKSG
jgi:hypothetical protein